MGSKKDKHEDLPGEGDKAAVHRYEEATREFVESGRVEKAAEQRARGQDQQEAEQSERAGAKRARKSDPAAAQGRNIAHANGPRAALADDDGNPDPGPRPGAWLCCTSFCDALPVAGVYEPLGG
jgi:hypothetical protein